MYRPRNSIWAKPPKEKYLFRVLNNLWVHQCMFVPAYCGPNIMGKVTGSPNAKNYLQRQKWREKYPKVLARFKIIKSYKIRWYGVELTIPNRRHTYE